jgi:hypothetical protein
MRTVSIRPELREYNHETELRFQQYKDDIHTLNSADPKASEGVYILQLAAIKASYNHDVRALREKYGIPGGGA